MKPLRTLVVDDEPLARERLSRLLQEAGCTVVDELEDGVALLQWLNQAHEVDVIFLDIQMPGLNGMEALAEAATYPPVVFVTAYSEYAVRAFELAAHDYLLKPVFPDRLAKCLDRLQGALVRRLSPTEIKALLPPKARFPVKAGVGEVFMDLEDMTHFELKEDHVIACRGQNQYKTRWTTLSEVEQAFPDDGMMRIQRHLLLRPRAVIGTYPAGIGRMKVLVTQGVHLPVSRAMTPRLRELLKMKAV